MRLCTNKLGRSSLILASLVLAAAITLPRAAFAAPAGTTVGPAPTLTPAGGKDPLISFGFNIGGNSGFGTLMATDMGGGQFQATSGTLTMSSTSSGDPNNTYCLVPAGAPGQVLTSPLGLFLYDDLVQPGANPAFPDIYALLFSNTAAACGPGFGGNDEINIWAGPQSGPPAPGVYSFYDGHPGGYPIAYTTPANVTDSFNAIVGNPYTYAYTGNAFNQFASPPGQYGPKDSVTAALVLSAPLPANMVTPINVCSLANATPPVNLLSLTLNDGVQTLTATCPTPTGAGAGATAWVTTDASGNINAWYLDVTVVGADIHTLYDPSSFIYAQCVGGCYSYPKVEDKGSMGSYYGSVHLQGMFIPPGQGGVTTAGNCLPPLGCQNSPVASTVVVTMAGLGPPPPNDLIVETSYYIPADPRGPNCGYYGATGQPTSILLSNVPVQKYQGDPNPATPVSSLGGEVIPSNICIPPGGAWVDIAIDEQLAGINGLNAYPNFAPTQTLTGIVQCPAAPTPNGGYTGQLTVSAPRVFSLVEEQQPQQLGSSVGQGHGIGPPQFTPAIQSCDFGKGSGVPARSITLFNVQFIQPNLLAKHTIPGTATNQQILVNEIASEVYYLRNGLLPLINFQQAPQVGVALQACYSRVQSLMSQGSYNCAAYQTYQCDQILKTNPVADVGPSYSVLRLPDPWGALHSDHLNLGFLFNAAAGINPASVSLDDPNVLTETGWPPRSCPTH
jgi:hypothetical protein